MDIYLGLGSNLGDRRANLARALAAACARTASQLAARLARRRVARDAARRRAGRLESAVPEPRRRMPQRRARRTSCSTRSEADRARARPRRSRPLGAAPDRSRHPAVRQRDASRPSACACRIPASTERAFVLTPLAALEPLLTIPGRGSRTVLELARAGGQHLPLWMGIVNVTPDSFSDGGELADWRRASSAHVAALASGRRRDHRPRRRVARARRDAADGRRGVGAARARARPLLVDATRGDAAAAALQHRHVSRRDRAARARARRRHRSTT